MQVSPTPAVVRVDGSIMQASEKPAHLRASDPGKAEGNVVFTYLDAFDEDLVTVADLKERYQRGGLGDSVVKNRLNDVLQAMLAPIRDRRQKLANDPAYVLEILKEGTAVAREVTQSTLEEDGMRSAYSALPDRQRCKSGMNQRFPDRGAVDSQNEEKSIWFPTPARGRSGPWGSLPAISAIA